jgi:acyl-CoA dehydrogenase
MEAVNFVDPKLGLKSFDKAIFAHFGFTLSNAVRTLIMGITNSRWVRTPHSPFKRYYQQLTRFSSALAFVSDLSMMLLGGSLKRKEKISARLGDVLSMLYLGSAVLKQFEDNGQREEEIPIVEWACQSLLCQAQKQLFDTLTNFPHSLMATLVRFWVFPLGKQLKEPSDKLGQTVARLMLNPNALRSTLAKDAYLTPEPSNPVGYIEGVLKKVIATEELEKNLHQAVQQKKVHGYTFQQKVSDAVMKKIITQFEAEQLLDTYQARKEVLAVDDFAPEELEGRHMENCSYQKLQEEGVPERVTM